MHQLSMTMLRTTSTAESAHRWWMVFQALIVSGVSPWILALLNGEAGARTSSSSANRLNLTPSLKTPHQTLKRTLSMQSLRRLKCERNNWQRWRASQSRSRRSARKTRRCRSPGLSLVPQPAKRAVKPRLVHDPSPLVGDATITLRDQSRPRLRKAVAINVPRAEVGRKGAADRRVDHGPSIDLVESLRVALAADPRPVRTPSDTLNREKLHLVHESHRRSAP